MAFTLDLPTGPVADAALSLVRDTEHPAIANHSLRSFLFAQLLAEHENCLEDTEYDRDLLFAATVMHDLGTGDIADGLARFEVEGADLAAALLRRHNVPERDVDRVWEAIALHSSPGIAERRGLLAYLTRGGISIDFGRNSQIVTAWGTRIHAAYPRLDMAQALIDAVVAHAARSPGARPRYAIGGELWRERQSDTLTSLELEAAASAWGC